MRSSEWSRYGLAGATPVVVEGPMDPIAVTLAGTDADGSPSWARTQ